MRDRALGRLVVACSVPRGVDPMHICPCYDRNRSLLHSLMLFYPYCTCPEELSLISRSVDVCKDLGTVKLAKPRAVVGSTRMFTAQEACGHCCTSHTALQKLVTAPGVDSCGWIERGRRQRCIANTQLMFVARHTRHHHVWRCTCSEPERRRKQIGRIRIEC